MKQQFHQKEDEQSIGRMDQNVEHVVPFRIVSGNGVVQRVGPHCNRSVEASAGFDNLPVVASKDFFQVDPVEPMDACVSFDEDGVVKNEASRQRVQIDKEGDDDDERHHQSARELEQRRQCCRLFLPRTVSFSFLSHMDTIMMLPRRGKTKIAERFTLSALGPILGRPAIHRQEA